MTEPLRRTDRPCFLALGFSADAVPALVDALDEVSHDNLERIHNQGGLAHNEGCYVDDDPWYAFNLARERAASALASYCP